MKSVDTVELVRCARIPLEPNVPVGGEVLILGDTSTEEAVLKALAAAAREIGVEPSVLVMETRPAPNMEPSRAAAAAMKRVDLMVNVTSHSIVHTEAVRAALGAGIKYIGMATATASTLTRGAATADPQELFEVTQRVAALMTEARSARVTSAHGTDVTLDLRGREAFVLVGRPFPGQVIVPFPSGEAPIAPVEEGTEGTIVFDTYMNPVGKLDQPVVLRVERGRIIGIEGGPEAEHLRKLLATRGDADSYFIGEFAIGTNPRTIIAGHIEDKFSRGSVHFGLGDNATLGGKVRAAIHLDGVILRPTVTLDGKVVVENGELRL